MPNDGIGIGQYIKQKRIEKGWTQEKLAERAKVSRNYISELESNQKKNPKLDMFLRLVEALEIDIIELNQKYSLIKNCLIKNR